MLGRRAFLLGSIALPTSSGSWSVRLPSGPAMQDGEVMAAPPEWRDFLAKYPDQASAPSGPLLPLNAVTHEDMYRTNAFWNTKMRYVRDRYEKFNCFERDNIGRLNVRGDCDDFALSKRRELRTKFPEYVGCFRLAICQPVGHARRLLSGGGYYPGNIDPLHAVLSVDTTGGTVILDMRGTGRRGGSTPYNVADQPEYRWITREATADHWMTIRNSA
jgi:predicted transglutaminase-like cysteine proteinase